MSNAEDPSERPEKPIPAPDPGRGAEDEGGVKPLDDDRPPQN